tara:strand:- start:479 stop:838 length:360 start_codon:yes stop_codon:yes gene_type:complete
MININNCAGIICSIIILILALCFLRYHLLLQEKFNQESLFNNKLTKQYEEQFKFTHDCSPKAFKKKMINYLKFVKKYREQEKNIYKLNDLMKKKYDEYENSMRLVQNAKTDLDFCVSTN